MQKVKLRELNENDLPIIAEYGNDNEIARNLRDTFPHPYSLADAEWFLNFTRGFTPRQNFAITQNDVFTGIMGVHPFDDIYRDTAEIGYWLGRPYWGQGIATFAVKQIVTYGWEVMNLKRIQAGVFGYNPASMRVLEKAGFEKEGVLRDRLIKEGNYHDEHIYAVIRED